MKRFIFLFFLFAGIALAPAKSYASEPDIASESELLGTFGSDQDIVGDSFNDFLDGVSGAGFDFVDDDGNPLEVPVSSNVPVIVNVDPDIGLYSDGAGLYSSYDTYYGAISSTYLEYMRGFLPKLGFRQHYVASRTSQYTYIFAYGEELSFNGSRFVGSNIQVITWNTSGNGSVYHNVEGSFSLNPGNFLVYTDLTGIYPTLTDLAGFTSRQLIIAFSIVFLVWTMDHMYSVRKIRRLKRGY